MSRCIYVYMYICIYVYMYMYIYICIYVDMYIYICICIYVYMYTCIHVYMYICIYVYIYVYMVQTSWNGDICIYTHTYTYRVKIAKGRYPSRRNPDLVSDPFIFGWRITWRCRLHESEVICPSSVGTKPFASTFSTNVQTIDWKFRDCESQSPIIFKFFEKQTHTLFGRLCMNLCLLFFAAHPHNIYTYIYITILMYIFRYVCVYIYIYIPFVSIFCWSNVVPNFSPFA